MSEENMNIDPQQGAEPNVEPIEQTAQLEFDSAELAAEDSRHEETVDQAPPKKRRTVSLKTCLLSNLITGVALIVATLMITYTVCTAIFQKQYAENLVKGEEVVVDSGTMSEIDLLNAYIDRYFYGDVDKDKMMAAALKAYIAATGDVYAAYYTLEELLANQETSAGRMSGIGINVVNDEFEYNGKIEKCLHIYNVMDGSPAQKAGVLRGDL